MMVRIIYAGLHGFAISHSPDVLGTSILGLPHLLQWDD